MRLGLGHGLDTSFNVPLLGNNFLLDTFSGAAAAYSLRKLSASTTNVVRVRRSSDDAEADFTATEVTDGTLTTWTGANDGHVVTWYDQSENTGRDATQATAAAQPKIVSAGTLILKNGKPSIEFDASDDFLIGPSTLINISNAWTIISVANENALGGNNGAYNISTNATYGITKFHNSGAGYTPFTIVVNNVSTSKFRPTGSISRSTNQQLVFDLFDGVSATSFGSYAFAINGNLSAAVDAGNVSSLNSNEFRIGRAGGTFTGDHFDGNYQELIIYQADKSDNRAAIETAINSHYNIY